MYMFNKLTSCGITSKDKINNSDKIGIIYCLDLWQVTYGKSLIQRMQI